MSFIETPRFPDTIASYGTSGGPGYRTDVIVTDSGAEQRNAIWSAARHAYDVSGGVKTLLDLEALIAHFHAMLGRLHGFRFKDYGDFSSAAYGSAVAFNDQTIGTGDTSETDFQLVKVYTRGALSTSRTITKPVSGTVKAGVNGVEKTLGVDFTVDTTTGIVTFASPPGSGHAVTAGYQYDVPVRFDTDTLSISLDDYLVGATTVPLVEIRV